MKHLIFGSAFLFIFLAENTFAACPTGPNYANSNQIKNLVKNRYACAVKGDDQWNEHHNDSNGDVTDYKKGPSDPIDPSEVVGKYSISSTLVPATINYDYGSGGSYSYCVTPASAGPGSYTFINETTNESFQVTVQNTPCAF